LKNPRITKLSQNRKVVRGFEVGKIGKHKLGFPRGKALRV